MKRSLFERLALGGVLTLGMVLVSALPALAQEAAAAAPTSATANAMRWC